ncbi:hypothetical protein HMPREF3207_01788 [Citrobacter koseri]|nr:hypothetical protein HMPREF3207_01788 [Citrobacter koseri]
MVLSGAGYRPLFTQDCGSRRQMHSWFAEQYVMHWKLASAMGV